MSNSLKGWTPRQAAVRCVAPAILAAHVDANREWAKTGYQKAFVLSASFWDTEEAAQAVRDRASKQLYDRSKRTRRAIWDHLGRHLVAETLLARGRRGSPTAEKKLLPPTAWRHLIFKPGGTAEEPDKTRIYDIEIYPTLLAPDMPIAVDGKPLSEVLRRFVRDDPQVQARQAKATETGAQVETFGVPVGPRTVWKFNHGRDYSEIIGFLNEPRPRVALIADMTIGKRYSALIAHLFEGRLVAEGLPNGMPPISSVPRSLWAHKDSYVDLRNGDLLRINGDTEEPADLLVSLYAAIVVRAPLAGLLPKAVATENLPRVRVKRARNKAQYPEPASTAEHRIHEAVRRLWPFGIPKGQLVKNRDDKIARHLREKGLPTVHPRTIDRYLRRYRQ